MINPGNSQHKEEMDEVTVLGHADASEVQERSSIPVVDVENEQHGPGEMQSADNAVSPSEKPVAPRTKKRVKKAPQVSEEDLMPRPSIWPILLAFSIAVALAGFAMNLILLGVGAVMVIVTIIGWNLERR